MIDNTYRNAFKEVYVILKNTDQELLQKIPNQFMKFLQDNMNRKYQINIKKDIEIDKQKILKETESILALIYRSYWATDEEKIEFANKDKNELIEQEKKKKQNFQGQDINEIFEKRKNTKQTENQLIILEKQSFIKKIINQILKILKKQKRN